MTDRLKEIIFKKLNTDLSKVEIIVHNESIWFIDRENKYWYLELVKSGKLYWRYQFFTQFFDLFTMDRERYEPLIKEWVELVLKLGVESTKTYSDGFNPKVESVLNDGVTSMHPMNVTENKLMESALNNGVTSFGYTNRERPVMVESALNNGASSTSVSRSQKIFLVDSVLNNGITSMSKHSNPLGFQVSIILNSSSITSSRPAKKSITIVESVLNNE